MNQAIDFENYYIKSKSREYGLPTTLVRERWEDFKACQKKQHFFNSFDEFLIITRSVSASQSR